MAKEVGRNREEGTDITMLPDKPSELLTLALADLESVESDPRYVIDMDLWHKPYRDRCAVCLAGAVIARTMGESPRVMLTVADFPEAISPKLFALNDFRMGYISLALSDLGIRKPSSIPAGVHVTPYNIDRDKFFADMGAMAALLREHGL
jgi:hypothetical protein